MASKFGGPERFRMANYLVRKGILQGLTQQTVIDMLGLPDRVWTQDDVVYLAFELCPQSAFPARSKVFPGFVFLNIDSWALEIVIQRSKVAQVRVKGT